MAFLNSLQCDMIEYLNTYGYLCGSHFQMLTGKSPGYIREMLGGLRRKGYVRSFRNAISNAVHTENMYVNTPLAIEFLTSHKNTFLDEIKTITTASVVKDFFHRYNSVSVSIQLRKCLIAREIPVRLMLSYFDKQGLPKKGTLVARTAIPIGDQKTIIPDIVFKTDSALYLIEMYCDKDTNRIINQLSGHAKAISLGSPAATFDLPKTNPYVMAVFQHPGIMLSVKKRLEGMEHFKPLAHLYFFAKLEDVLKDCGNAWQIITGENLVFK